MNYVMNLFVSRTPPFPFSSALLFSSLLLWLLFMWPTSGGSCLRLIGAGHVNKCTVRVSVYL